MSLRRSVLMFLLLSMIVCSLANHTSSDSSDDDDSHKDKHSNDVTQEVEKEKHKEKKEKNEEPSDDEQAKWTGEDIDNWFLGEDKPSKEDRGATKTTTSSPPLGMFGPDFSKLQEESSGSEQSSGATTAAPESKSHGESGEVSDNHGSTFSPTSRPIDIWDRLIVLAAFPICFFAVMLKAEMFR